MTESLRLLGTQRHLWEPPLSYCLPCLTLLPSLSSFQHPTPPLLWKHSCYLWEMNTHMLTDAHMQTSIPSCTFVIRQRPHTQRYTPPSKHTDTPRHISPLTTGNSSFLHSTVFYFDSKCRRNLEKHM